MMTKLMTTTALLLAALTTGCSSNNDSTQTASSEDSTPSTGTVATTTSSTSTEIKTLSSESSFALDDFFSNRDSRTTIDSETPVTLTFDGKNITADGDGVTIEGSTVTITAENTYILKGSLTEGQVIVDMADDTHKCQLYLDGMTITNSTAGAINVQNADKVFITTAEGSENTITVTIAEDEKVDGGIYSKKDVTFNGEGTLTVNVTGGDGIIGKDELTITSGTYYISADEHGLDSNDGIAIAGGTFHISTGKDGLHAEHSTNESKGYIFIADGTFYLDVQGDGLDTGNFLEIWDGFFDITTAGGWEMAPIKVAAANNMGGGGGMMGMMGQMGGMATQGQQTTDRNQQGQQTTDRNQQGQQTTDRNQQGQETTDRNQQGQETTDRNQQGTDRNQQGQGTDMDAMMGQMQGGMQGMMPEGMDMDAMMGQMQGGMQGMMPEGMDMDAMMGQMQGGMQGMMPEGMDMDAIMGQIGGMLPEGFELPEGMSEEEIMMGMMAMMGQMGGRPDMTVLPEGNYVIDGEEDENAVSTKGLKSQGALRVYGGDFILDCYDDALHSDSTLEIHGGNFDISTADDAVHANWETYIGGGNLNIITCFEGIEGQRITITGGDVSIYANDDGINAATTSPDPDNSEIYLHISGGNIVMDTNSEGDGVDSNGSILITGGNLLISSTIDQRDTTLDSQTTSIILGGSFVGTGSNSATIQNFDTGSTQASILVKLSAMQLGTVTLTDASGNVLVEFEPPKEYQAVIISLPELTVGEDYVLTAGEYVENIALESLQYGTGNSMGGGMTGGRR